MPQIKGIVTEYDIRLTKGELDILCYFLDKMLPINARMPLAEPGEPRQRLSDEELITVRSIRRALYREIHG